jgi:hypothetical protein
VKKWKVKSKKVKNSIIEKNVGNYNIVIKTFSNKFCYVKIYFLLLLNLF